MKKKIYYRLLLVALTLALVASGCTMAVQPQQAATPAAAEQENFEMRVLPVELSHPLELVYGPDGYLWITERTGKRITRVNPEDGSSKVAITIPEVYQRANQDGLLGLALHPELLQGTGNDYVYTAFVYAGEGSSGNRVNRRLTIRRYRYDAESETLGEPLDLLTNLPGSGDHNSGKFVFGEDEKLYYVIGEQGHNQFAGACLPIYAQVTPTAEEVNAQDWSFYPGKVLRMNLDGSIPEDNPTFDGVLSHVYSVGHRNVQGLVMSEAGLLYGAEHGPKTDDEINLIEAGKNYGWPHVAGYQDDQSYVYANWSAAQNCRQLQYSDYEIPASVPQHLESEWSHPDFTPPLHTFGTVPAGYDFRVPECAPNEFICWPTIAPTGMELYNERPDGMPGWATSLLVTALKTGTVYRLELSDDGRSVEEPIPYFKTTNRYRDIAIGPDGRTFYVITDNDNYTLGPDGLPTDQLENRGAVLVFTYRAE